MKKLFFVISLIMGLTMQIEAQTARQVEKMYSKMYKSKVKEYKKGGWKLTGSSKTIEVTLYEHYEALKKTGNTELVGEVSRGISLNACKQAAFNNAIITYGNLAGSTLKGRITSDINIDQSDANGEFDKMYAAYERLVKVEIKGILTPSYAIVKERGKTKQYKAFFLVNEEKAQTSRMRALERAFQETEVSQKYAREISDFVREGFEQTTP